MAFACSIPVSRFRKSLEWRQEIGFFASDPHQRDQSTSHEYKLRLGDVIYQLADGRWMFVDNTSLPDWAACLHLERHNRGQGSRAPIMGADPHAASQPGSSL
jgi:hypothetical protein